MSHERRAPLEPEEVIAERIETVVVYGGLLEMVCLLVHGEWEVVGVWAGREHVVFDRAEPS